QHVAADMQPPAMEEHAGKDRRPGRYDREFCWQCRGAEQHRRDHPEAVGDDAVILAELPQEHDHAERDQRVGDDWGPCGRMVVVERQEKEHTPYLAPSTRRRERVARYRKGFLPLDTAAVAAALVRRRAGRPRSRAAYVPTRPSCGLDGSAIERFGMRPARC